MLQTSARCIRKWEDKQEKEFSWHFCCLTVQQFVNTFVFTTSFFLNVIALLTLATVKEMKQYFIL